MNSKKEPLFYTVQTDLYIARRKRMHAVHDPGGVPVFHARHLIEVLDWLAEKDENSALFTDDETAYVVSFDPVQPDQPEPNGEPHG